jgi:hypothetical protein
MDASLPFLTAVLGLVAALLTLVVALLALPKEGRKRVTVSPERQKLKRRITRRSR